MLLKIDINARDILGGFGVPPIQALNEIDAGRLALRDGQNDGVNARPSPNGIAHLPGSGEASAPGEKGQNDTIIASAAQQPGPKKDQVNAPKSSGETTAAAQPPTLVSMPHAGSLSTSQPSLVVSRPAEMKLTSESSTKARMATEAKSSAEEAAKASSEAQTISATARGTSSEVCSDQSSTFLPADQIYRCPSLRAVASRHYRSQYSLKKQPLR